MRVGRQNGGLVRLLRSWRSVFPALIAILAFALASLPLRAQDTSPAQPTQDPRSWRVFAGGRSGSGQISYPTGIALDRQGNLYVADNLNERVQKSSPGGAVLAVWQFGGADDVGLDGVGNVYVGDFEGREIRKLSADGAPLTQWTIGEFPVDMLVDAQVTIYLARHVYSEFTHYKVGPQKLYALGVERLGPDGAVAASWSLAGSEQRRTVASLALDASGTPIVGYDSDQWTFSGSSVSPGRICFDPIVSIRTLSSEGTTHIRTYNVGADPTQVLSFGAIATDTAGNVYLPDLGRKEIRVLSASGEERVFIPSAWSG